MVRLVGRVDRERPDLRARRRSVGEQVDDPNGGGRDGGRADQVVGLVVGVQLELRAAPRQLAHLSTYLVGAAREEAERAVVPELRAIAGGEAGGVGRRGREVACREEDRVFAGAVASVRRDEVRAHRRGAPVPEAVVGGLGEEDALALVLGSDRLAVADLAVIEVDRDSCVGPGADHRYRFDRDQAGAEKADSEQGREASPTQHTAAARVLVGSWPSPDASHRFAPFGARPSCRTVRRRRTASRRHANRRYPGCAPYFQNA